MIASTSCCEQCDESTETVTGFTVDVTDGGHYSASSSVTILVVDVNEKPSLSDPDGTVPHMGTLAAD